MIEIYAQKCLMCGDEIYSRATHDFHYCFCGNIYVDGGVSFVGEESYSRVGYSFSNLYESVIIKLDTNMDKVHTKSFLRRDWNKHIEKYGCRRDKNYTNEMRIAAKAKIKLLERK